MITIFSTTNRPDNNSHKVALLYKKAFEEKELKSRIFSFEELPRDIAFSETFGNRSQGFSTFIQDYIETVERFVFVVPEYNGSFPGILKVFLDSVDPYYWEGKKAALAGIATGRAGNLLGLDQLTSILHYLKVNVYHDKPLFSLIHNHFNDDFGLSNVEYEENIKKQVEGFMRI